MKILLIFLVIIFEVTIMFTFVTRLYNNFNKAKIPFVRKLSILFLLIFSSLSFELLILLKHNNASIIYAISLLIIHKLVLKENIKCTSVATLITCMLISLSNNISSSIYLLFEKTNTNEELFMVLPLIFLALIFIPILNYVKKNSNKLQIIIENTGTSAFNTLLLYTVLLCLPITLSTSPDVVSKRAYLFLVIVTILFSICIFTKHYINSKYNKIQSKIYEKNLNSTIDELRIIKHDYDNILQAIYGYIATRQYDSLNNYLKYLSLESRNLNYDGYLTPSVINQPAIYGIITSKYCKALEKEIDFDINIKADISNISFNFAELSRILGILLDNAIEASEKTDAKKLSVLFNEDKETNSTMIEIRNSIKDNNIDVVNIFNKGVSSKKIKSGIGLWEVKRLIDSTKNSTIQTSIENNTFSQKLVIQNA